MRKRLAVTALLAAIPLLVTACGGGGGDITADPGAAGGAANGDGGNGLSGDLAGAGATFPTPLFQDWTFDYNADVQPGVAINYQSIGSGGGIEQFLQQTVDFGSSERFLDEEDLAAAEEARGCPAIQFPVIFGSVVPAFNDPELDQLILDADTIAAIFDRQITNYNDPAIAALNPDRELPDQDIIPVHRSDGSGTTYVFTRYLADEVPAWDEKYGFGTEVNWASGTVGGQGNEGVAAGIQQNPGGFGYVNQSYALEQGFPQAQVVNADGQPVYPTLESTTEAAELAEIPDNFQFDILGIGGGGFPITGTNWIFAYECGYDENTEAMLKDFWTWSTQSEEADQLALELGYAPMGSELKERVLGEIERINAQG